MFKDKQFRCKSAAPTEQTHFLTFYDESQ